MKDTIILLLCCLVVGFLLGQLYERYIYFCKTRGGILQNLKKQRLDDWDRVLRGAGVSSSSYYFERLVKHLKECYYPPVEKD